MYPEYKFVVVSNGRDDFQEIVKSKHKKKHASISLFFLDLGKNGNANKFEEIKSEQKKLALDSSGSKKKKKKATDFVPKKPKATGKKSLLLISRSSSSDLIDLARSKEAEKEVENGKGKTGSDEVGLGSRLSASTSAGQETEGFAHLERLRIFESFFRCALLCYKDSLLAYSDLVEIASETFESLNEMTVSTQDDFSEGPQCIEWWALFKTDLKSLLKILGKVADRIQTTTSSELVTKIQENVDEIVSGVSSSLTISSPPSTRTSSPHPASSSSSSSFSSSGRTSSPHPTSSSNSSPSVSLSGFPVPTSARRSSTSSSASSSSRREEKEVDTSNVMSIEVVQHYISVVTRLVRISSRIYVSLLLTSDGLDEISQAYDSRKLTPFLGTVPHSTDLNSLLKDSPSS